MKKLLTEWRKFINEKSFKDYGAKKGEWIDIPTGDLRSKDPENTDISDELFDMISKSYAGIGGHIDFQSADDLPSNHTDWKAVDVDYDPEPDAVRIGKNSPAGLKMTGGASDGDKQGKKAYIDKTAEMLNTPGNWGEFSNAIAHVMITRYQSPYVDNEADVEKLLKGKDVEWLGAHPQGKYPGYDGWYRRQLGGKKHLKIMMGRPNGASVSKP